MSRNLTFALGSLWGLVACGPAEVQLSADDGTRSEVSLSLRRPGYKLGVDLPLVGKFVSLDAGFNDLLVQRTLDLHPAVVRLWIPRTIVARPADGSPLVFDPNATAWVAETNRIIGKLQAGGATVVGMVEPSQALVSGERSGNQWPCPRSEAALFAEAVKRYGEAWRVIVRAFPRVRVWEQGNEMNGSGFDPARACTPAETLTVTNPTTGASSLKFRWNIRAEMTAEMLLRSYAAIKAVDSSLVAFGPGLAPLRADDTFAPQYDLSGLAVFVATMGQYVRTAHPGRTLSDAMDGAAWHPYLDPAEFDRAARDRTQVLAVTVRWAQQNQRLFDVFQANAARPLNAYLSEFGFNASCATTRYGRSLCDIAADNLLFEGAVLSSFSWLWGASYFTAFDDASNRAVQSFGLMDDPTVRLGWKRQSHTMASLAANAPPALGPGEFAFELNGLGANNDGFTFNPTTLKSIALVGGQVWGRSFTARPVVYSADLNLPLGAVTKVEVTLMAKGGTRAAIVYRTRARPAYSPTTEVGFDLNADHMPHTYTLDLSKDPNWMQGGVLNQIAIVPTNVADVDFAIDSLRVLR